MTGLLQKVVRDETGGTAIEYGLIASLIAIAALGAIGNFANTSSGIWLDIANKTEAANNR